MNLLLTGAVNYTNAQIEKLREIGYEITFVQDERIPLEIDCSVFDAVVCNGLFLYNPVEKFTNLKLVQLTSAGLDRAPVEYFNKNNIKLFNARGVYSIPMAEWVLLMALEIYKKSYEFYKQQANRAWKKHRDIAEINSKSVCVVGTGSVGQECLKRFSAFGARTIGVDIVNPKSEYIDEFVLIDNLNEALGKSDIVVLTLPLLDSTRGIINDGRMSAMKNDSVLINVSRGGVINESDLIKWLNKGKFKGVALDVFEEEPLAFESPLWNYDNVILTPHNSFVGDRNCERLFDVIYNNLNDFINS
ncbi:MAG: NAD(P)-dependent oxidoreductase [Oscillospiraceae bacterium]